jgi:Skp family chaperone for outer membrane proteins
VASVLILLMNGIPKSKKWLTLLIVADFGKQPIVMTNKWLAFTTFLLLVCSSISAQSIAYIRQDTLLAETPNYVKFINENDSIKKFYTDEIKLEFEKLDKKIDNLLRPYNPKEGETIEDLKARFSAADLTRLELLQKESEMLEQKTKSYNQLLSMHYAEKIQPLLDKINSEISKYSVKNKIDMVFILEEIGPKLAYINDKKDITNDIIKLIKTN